MALSIPPNRLLLHALSVLLVLGSGFAQSTSIPAPSAMPAECSKWVEEDVRWIITPAEKAEFAKVNTLAECDRFVVDFWAKRDRTAGTPKNGFKEEHYRRLAYANTHFAAGRAGWLTDRGQIYIVYGPPTAIRERQISGKPAQVWLYRLLPEVEFTFVDECHCGDYTLIPSPKP